MLGLDAEAIMAPLREMIFGYQTQIAGTRPIWVEKTATNIFHLEALEPLLSGHVRFIYITRNPLDVVASNMDLAQSMGAQLSDLFEMTRGNDILQEGIMKAWINRTEMLDEFASRHGEDCHCLRYEDLTLDPVNALGSIMTFMGIETDINAQIANAFSRPGQIGLGDFRIDNTTAILPAKVNEWRKRLPRSVSSRIIPLAAELMERHGYDVPKPTKLPDRDTAIRQFLMAAEFKRNSAHKP